MPFVSIRLYVELYLVSKEWSIRTNWSTVILIKMRLEYKIIPQLLSLDPCGSFFLSFALHFVVAEIGLEGCFSHF
jgi:hypothetical protein